MTGYQEQDDQLRSELGAIADAREVERLRGLLRLVVDSISRDSKGAPYTDMGYCRFCEKDMRLADVPHGVECKWPEIKAAAAP